MADYSNVSFMNEVAGFNDEIASANLIGFTRTVKDKPTDPNITQTRITIELLSEKCKKVCSTGGAT